MFSIKNSFDYKNKNNNVSNILPFTGEYEQLTEQLTEYKFIYIYINTIKNDTLYIQFTNNKNDTLYEIQEKYNFNNVEKELFISKKLKYFRIKIETSDSFIQSDKRIYNTYYYTTPINTTENAYNLHRDAFNRLRVSNPFTIFDSKNINKKNDKFTNYPTNNSGITYNIDNSTISLECTSGNTNIIRESKNTFAYQPGKSLLILNTFVFGGISGSIPSQVSNATQRVGYFDDYNGIYLEVSNDSIKMCKRTYVNGSIDNSNKISIDDWNGNPSACNLDFSKAQIFWIDIEWLGVGSVRTGFVVNGEFILAHTFNHANVVSDVYMTSAQLPIRYEITYISASTILKQICSTVISEGGYDGSSIVRHIGSDSSGNIIAGTDFTLNTNVVACAIRIQKNSGKLYNSIIIPSQLSIYLNNQQGNNSAKFPIIEYKLYLNPSGLTYTWNSYSTDYSDSVSTIEYALKTNITGTLSGGIIVQSGFLEGKNVINLSSSKDFNLQLGKNITGISSNLLQYDSDILVLVFKTLYVDNSAPIVNVAYKLGWYEI
jgi:hypothetical protein